MACSNRKSRGELLSTSEVQWSTTKSGGVWGNLDLWCPRDLVVTSSQHYCMKCNKYFNADLSDLVPPGGQYTHRVIDLAVRLVVEDGVPYRPASWHLWRDHRVFVPFATIQNWVEAGGKKGAGAHGHRLPELGVS